MMLAECEYLTRKAEQAASQVSPCYLNQFNAFKVVYAEVRILV